MNGTLYRCHFQFTNGKWRCRTAQNSDTHPLGRIFSKLNKVDHYCGPFLWVTTQFRPPLGFCRRPHHYL